MARVHPIDVLDEALSQAAAGGEVTVQALSYSEACRVRFALYRRRVGRGAKPEWKSVEIRCKGSTLVLYKKAQVQVSLEGEG